jgi:hypothetical protein
VSIGHFARGESFWEARAASPPQRIRRGEPVVRGSLPQTWMDKLCPNRHGECRLPGGLRFQGKWPGRSGAKFVLDMLARNFHKGDPPAIISPPGNQTKGLFMTPPTLASIMAAVIVCPALANDPSMASGTATTTTNSAPNRTTTTTTVTANPGRKVWVRKRIIHLKQKMKDDDKAQRTADKLDIMLGNFPTRPATYKRQHMLDRFEFLAIKKEAKGLTPKEYAEMQSLRQQLLYGN